MGDDHYWASVAPVIMHQSPLMCRPPRFQQPSLKKGAVTTAVATAMTRNVAVPEAVLATHWCWIRMHGVMNLLGCRFLCFGKPSTIQRQMGVAAAVFASG